MTSSGTPASSRRSSSAAQSSGRYRARPIRACPAGAAQVRVTATWHRAIPPRVPLYWRAAPAQSAGGLGVGGLVHDQHHVARRPGLRSGARPPSPRRRRASAAHRSGRGTAGAASGAVRGARRPRPWSSSCDPPAPSAGRAPCRGRSGGSPAGRSTARPAPAGHRAGPRARHHLRWHQRLSCDCSVPQTGMITAAAPASRASGLPLPECRRRRNTPPASRRCDLQLRHQGHDLQLPYL